MSLPRLLIFASGTQEGGGSGFERLVNGAHSGLIEAEIVGVVCQHANGGVRQKAQFLKVPFIRFGEFTDLLEYRQIIETHSPDFIALSGWTKFVRDLDSKITFNIHPAPLPQFGGKGMYGLAVHEAVIRARQAGEVTCSAVTMHFVSGEYDSGLVFFEQSVGIYDNDTPEKLQARVKNTEHIWQPKITNLVVTEQISWDGFNPASLKVPAEYRHLKQNVR